MARDNAEIVRLYFADTGDLVELFGDEDAAKVLEAAVSEVVHPDCEVVGWVAGSPAPLGQGVEGMADAWRDLLAGWETFSAEIEQIHEIDDDRVLALGVNQGRTERDGVEVAAPSGAIYSFRDGKISRVEYFTVQADALEAAGLERHASPQGNFDLVRRIYGIVNRRDFDRGMRALDPEVELYPALSGPGTDVRAHYRGHDEVREFFETITAAEVWETITVEPDEMIEVPGNRVLAVERWHVRGRDDIEVETELTDVYTVRDGLIVRMEGFRDKAEAFEAVGLRSP